MSHSARTRWSVLFVIAMAAYLSIGPWPRLGSADEPATQPAAPAAGDVGVTMTTPSGLKITTVAKGKGASNGDEVVVHYSGKLEDGTEFDSSYKRNEPIKFVLGQGTVIKGWEEGLLGMQVGEKRRLVIPPDLGYGDKAQGPIPANSTLIFDVQLMGLTRG